VRGLIGRDADGSETHFTLTPAGDALAHAKGMARMTRMAAQDRLDAYLQAIDRAITDPDFPYDIRQIWLFGSLVKNDKPDVGDIDLAVDKVRRSRFRDLKSALKIARARGYDDSNASGAARYHGPEMYLERTILFGRRCPPYLSFTTPDTIVSLAEPCRLVYDATRGGRVADPVLAKHPAADQRSPKISPPEAMPDLAPRDMSLPALYLTSPSYWSLKTSQLASPELISDSWHTLSRVPIIPAGTTRYRREAEADARIGRLAAKIMSPTSELLLCPAGHIWRPTGYMSLTSPVLLAVERAISVTATGIDYTLHVSAIDGATAQQRRMLAPHLAPFIEFIAFADAFHIKLLLKEKGVDQPVSIRISACDPAGFGDPLLRAVFPMSAQRPE